MLPIMSNGKQPLKLTPIVVNISLFVTVLVVYTYQATSEGQYLAKGDEYRMMYLSQRWKDKARHQQHASKDA
jgi:hypothetical protein